MAIFFVPKPVRRSWFLRSLWRSRIAKADVFMAKTPRNLRNPWLINDLRRCKALYICRDTSTAIESALQIRLFMQNEPNFRKSQMNVNKVLTKDYEKRTLSEHGKNEPKTNPIYPVVASGEAGTNPIFRGVTSGEAGSNPISSRYRARTQCLYVLLLNCSPAQML